MTTRLAAALLVLTATLPGCGDDDGHLSGPQPLVEDPAVLTGCMPDALSAGQTRAKRVACAEELTQGALTSGRINDIVLENSRIKVVIRAFGEGYVFPGTGYGGIVDAARVDGEDLLRELSTLVEFNVAQSTEIVITEAGDDGPATVVVRGPARPVPLLGAAVNVQTVASVIETRYILEPDSTHVLVRTYLHRDGDKPRPTVQLGDIFSYGGHALNWAPGVGLLEGTGAGELMATTGTSSSYGITYPGNTSSLQLLSIANLTMGLGPNVTVGTDNPIDRFFIIGDGSVSSVTDTAWSLREVSVGSVSGTTAPGINVEVYNSSGEPFTVARANAQGAYALDLPVGDYTLAAGSPGHAVMPAQALTVSAGGQHTQDLTAGGSGRLVVSAKDDGDTPLPARVLIRSADKRIEYTDVSGVLDIALPPGQYTVDVSRGMEYDAFTVDPLVITDAATTNVEAVLTRVVDTSGWIAVDTHLHSEMSIDSSIPLTERLSAVAGEGVEVAVSTDHDFVTDYGPYVAALGLGDWVAYRIGVETTSLAWGHANAWPMQPDYDLGGGGAFKWYGLAPDATFALMRARDSNIVIQLNHPRLSNMDLFNIIEYNPTLGRATVDPALVGFPDADFDDLNFDAMEVANDISDDEFESALADWLSMVAFGHPVTPTGSSDSHGKSRYAGEARTYVYVGPGNDDPSTVDLAAVDQALRERKVVVSQGAFVTASIEDPGTGSPSALGALVNLSGETNATIHIKVQAAPWMQLSRIRIFAGQVEALSVNLDGGDTNVVRYDASVTVPLGTTDGFFVVVVDAGPSGSPVLDGPGSSFTSPLMFDRDGDSVWTPKSPG